VISSNYMALKPRKQYLSQSALSEPGNLICSGFLLLRYDIVQSRREILARTGFCFPPPSRGWVSGTPLIATWLLTPCSTEVSVPTDKTTRCHNPVYHILKKETNLQPCGRIHTQLLFSVSSQVLVGDELPITDRDCDCAACLGGGAMME
jgi:hypothetical protein